MRPYVTVFWMMLADAAYVGGFSADRAELVSWFGYCSRYSSIRWYI